MDEQTINEEANAQATFAQVIEEAETEYQQIQNEMREISMLIRQSTDEVENLSQRNAQISNRLRLMESNIDTMPREDIQEIYRAAQDTQSRLFMMRGQVEQLQGKQQYLERYANHLKHIIDSYYQREDVSESGLPVNPGANITAASSMMNIINAQEQERLHLSRQLHDGPAQSLTNLILQAEIVERLFDKDPSRARNELITLKDAVNETFQKIREYIFQLRPMMRDDLGVIPTLKQYVQEFENTHENLACKLLVAGAERRLPAHIEVTLFRVIQALLNNVADHAHATEVNINIELQRDRISATITDNGDGFDVEEAIAEAPKQKHMGIISMQEQITMLHGDITFDSGIGRGTTVSLWLPTE